MRKLRLFPPPVITRCIARIAISGLALAVSSESSFAEVRRFVDVRYERQDGTQSEPYAKEVTFVTGKELNNKTRSFDYSPYSNYVLVWFDQDEVAIVEIDTFLFGVGPDFDGEDFKKAFRLGMDLDGSQVNSRSSRKWHFAGKRLFRWIDPRVEPNR